MTQVTRRDFLKLTSTAAAGLALGDLSQLGVDMGPLRRNALRLRTQGAKTYPSVCPYCAVGCSQLISVQDGKITNIEGNPDSPINGGTLCPKGAATYQLTVNPQRVSKALYRAPGGTQWEEKPLDWCMDRIAEKVKAVRDATFQEKLGDKTVNRTMALASLGGATLDNEENYLMKKYFGALGMVYIENQARI